MATSKVSTPPGLAVVEAPEAAESVSIDHVVTDLLTQGGAAVIGFVSHTEPRLRKTDNPWYDPESKTMHLLKVSRKIGMINFHYDQAVERQLVKEMVANGELNEGATPMEIERVIDERFRRGGSYHVPVLTDEDRLTPLAAHKEDAAALVGWGDHHDLEDGRPVDLNRPITKGKNKGKHKPLALRDCTVKTFRTRHIREYMNKFGERPRLYLRFRQQRSRSVYIDTRTGEEVPKDSVRPFEQTSDYSNQGTEEPVVFLTHGLTGLREVSVAGTKYIVAG